MFVLFSHQDGMVGARPREGDLSRTGWCERDLREREFLRDRDGGLVAGDWGAGRWAAGPQAGWPPPGNNLDLRTREGGPAPPPPHDLRRDGHLNDRRDLVATGALGTDPRPQGLEARPRRDVVNDSLGSSGSHLKAFAPPPPPPLPPGPAPVPPPPIDKPPPDRFSPERASSRDRAKLQAKPPPPPPPITQPHASPSASAFPPPHNQRFGPAPVAPSATSCMDEVMEDLSVRSPGAFGPSLGLCPPMDKGGLQGTPDAMLNLQRNYYPDVALGFDKGGTVLGMNLVAVGTLRPGLGVGVPIPPPLLAPPPPPSSPPRDHPTGFAHAPRVIPSLLVPPTSSMPPMPSAPPPPPHGALPSNVPLPPAEANTTSPSLPPQPSAPPVSSSTPLIFVVSSTGSESPTAR